MASQDYLPLFWAARRAHLGNIARVSKEIKELYREAAADLAARAASSRKGSLTERWASEYAHSLEQRVKELEAGLYDVTLQGLKRSAELPASAMGQWWEAVGGQSFRDAFAATPDNVLAGLIEGGFYKDRKGLSERIWRVAQGFEKDVGYIVQRGIAEKKTPLELARDLEQYVKPPAKRDFDWGKVYPNLSGKKADFNAQRLARTSINHAYHLDNVKVCTENPFVVAMHWDLSNAHYERQVIPFGPDECDEYAEHDEGLGEGNWKPEEIPVPHPQCLCVHWPVIPDSLEDIGARIGAWASGEPDELLDEWYDKYGSRNPNGDAREILREGLNSRADSGIIKTNDRFYKENDDPMYAAFGKAEDSNPDELSDLILRLAEIGVGIERHEEDGAAIAYQNIRVGVPGTISVTPYCSYSAWLHEAQHAFDDYDAGWNSCLAAWDVDEHIRREVRAYQVEIDLAKSYGRPDIAKQLEENRDNEIAEIRRRDELYAEEYKIYNDGGT